MLGPPAGPGELGRLGTFRVLAILGRGGMGVVFRAEDTRLERAVALKVMLAKLAADVTARRRFLREARAAAAVDHENVVPIFHVGDEGGAPYLVMPLLRGESLQSRLQRDGYLAPAEVPRVGRDVAAGLAAAHARGLVHRDIKPSNIWLEGEPGSSAAGGRARILDFGLAHAADAADAADGLTAPGAILGTPAFMAPEVVDGQPADPRSDLFSLGATLYLCAAGRQPFAGPTLTATLRAVTLHHPPPPNEVNPGVGRPMSDVIMRLIAKDPSTRPASAGEVGDLLAGHGDQSPTTAWPVPRASAGGRRTVIAVAAAVAIIAVLGAWVVTQPPARSVKPPPASDPIGPTADAAPAARYRGRVDVLVERSGSDGRARLLRLNEPGALPLRKTDKFRIEGEVSPPAYLYVVWVDPGHDVTPVFPWDPKAGWGSRPPREQPVGRVSLPPDAGRRYTAPDASPGVATIVLFARPTPLEVADEVVRGWFEGLPELPLPAGGEQAAVWFDEYMETRDADRPRTFGEVGSDDAFAGWQARLQKSLGGPAAFQTAVSFARASGK